MRIANDQLVTELLLITGKAMDFAQLIKNAEIGHLNYRHHPSKWTVLECIEHLNLYGDFYLPAIQQGLLSTKIAGDHKVFQSGIIGNYFANLMKGKNGRIRKIKSPKDKNPIHSVLTQLTVERFIKQLITLQALLSEAESADMTHIRIPISISKLVKLRLGDTLRFFVYHIERHMVQAEKALVAAQQSRLR